MPDKIDKAKFGEALAKTLDRMEQMDDAGHVEGYTLEEVLVVAVLVKPHDAEDALADDQLDSLVFVDGTTQMPHTQLGILTMALNVAQGVRLGDDDD